MDIHENISAEQAFSLEPSPDTFPISKEDQDECIKAVRTFLAQKYPKDTGKWVLKTLQRDHGYIHAILKRMSKKAVDLWIKSRSSLMPTLLKPLIT